MKALKLEKIFGGLFILALLISAIHKPEVQKKVDTIEITQDSLTKAVRVKDSKSIRMDSLHGKVNIRYILSLSDFDTVRLDSQNILLIPKRLSLSNSELPIKKK